MMSGKTCDTAVILAAGSGTRVRSLSGEHPKCLMELGGRRIIDWILDSLAAGGIRSVVVITGYKGAMIRQAVDSGRTPLKIRYVHNRRWREPNGLSLYAARRAIGPDKRFLAVMSDHLLPPGIIRGVAEAVSSKCLLAVDTAVENVFDLSDATKVRLSGGRPVAIGKRLRRFNAVDCGLFRFDGRMFEALRHAIRTGETSLSAAVKHLIADGDLEVMAVAPDMFWIDIDTPKAFRHAEARIEDFVVALKQRKHK